MLRVYATMYKETQTSSWEFGVRIESPLESGEDVIIDKDGLVLGEVWELVAAHHYGTFVLRNEEGGL